MISTNEVFITPNHRLKEQLLHNHHATHHYQTIEKPLCFEYNEFLIYLFEQLYQKYPKTPSFFLLSPFNLRQWWRFQLLNDPYVEYHEGLLEKSLAALKTCIEWNVSTTHALFQNTPQTAWFQKHYHEFESYLHTSQQLTTHHLPRYLIKHPSSLSEGLCLRWICFDHFTPNQQQLQDAFKAKGHLSFPQDHPPRFNQSHQIAANDLKDEYAQLIQWAKETVTDQKKIGIIVPDLEQTATKLYDLFGQHFPKHWINISLGKPLIEFPIISHAFHGLALNPKKITIHQLSFLLTSPYFDLHRQNTLYFLKYLRQSPLLQEEYFSIEELKAIHPHDFSFFYDKINLLPLFPKKASPTLWINHFRKRLAYLGFPGHASLNSFQYQCIKKLDDVFDTLQNISLIKIELSEQEALDVVLDHVKNTVFQPETTKDRPIQILGLLEASGCFFDALWMVHVTHNQFPEKTQFSPFIPIDLQKTGDMPKTNPSKELDIATQLIRRFQNSSPMTLFSYSKHLGDEPQLPCSLIRDFPVCTIPYEKNHRIQTALISEPESYRVPLLTPTKRTGGTNILAHQARCPFQAFGIHRLYLKADLSSAYGLSGIERGDLLHTILEAFWRIIVSQETLLNTPILELEQMLQNIIQSHIKKKAMAHPRSFSPFIQHIEAERILKLLQVYLCWEKNRPLFKVIGLEEKNTLTLGNLTLNITVDRIDHLTHGKKWIIDYKSRLPATKPWNNPSLEDPQLLIYALLSEEIEGILFLELRHGQLTCCGYTAQESNIEGLDFPKEPKAWLTEKEQWHAQLTQLAYDFEEGHCAPKPLSKKICSRCHLNSLCRKGYTGLSSSKKTDVN